MTLTEFLLARIADDERAALAVRPLQIVYPMGAISGLPQRYAHYRAGWHPEDGMPWRMTDEAASDHFDRHGPARVLAECAAKRRIVEREVNSRTRITFRRMMALQDLAAIYADHPDYDESWAL